MSEITCADFLGYYLLIVVGLIIYFFVNMRISDNYLPDEAPVSSWVMSLFFGVPFLMLAYVRIFVDGIFFKKKIKTSQVHWAGVNYPGLFLW